MGEDGQTDRELLVLQHDPISGPAALTTTLDGRATTLPWRLVDLARAGVPALDDGVAGVLVLGAPRSVTEPDEIPWLDAALAFLRDAVDAEVPVFGICLGAQLLATALGGAVQRRDAPEVGFLPLERTLGAQDDEVFAGWSDGARALLLHEDEVTRLPAGAVDMLRGSDGHAAWRTADGRSYGVQAHPEVDVPTLETWLARDDFRALVAAAEVDPEAFLDEARRRDRFTRAAGVSLVGRWVDGVVA